MQGFQPFLDVERFDGFRDFVAEPGHEIIADQVIEVENRILGFGTQGVFSDIGPKIMFGEHVEADTVKGRGLIDADQHAKPVHLAPDVALLGKVADRANGGVVLHPSAVRCCHAIAQDPVLTVL